MLSTKRNMDMNVFMYTRKIEPNVVYRAHSISLDWISDWNLREAEKSLRVGSDGVTGVTGVVSGIVCIMGRN
jgi:hypothetical protein